MLFGINQGGIFHDIRIEHAKQLLRDSALRVGDVAEQVGFTDYSSFYRAFKQEYGISPRQYRKLQNL